MALNRLNQFAPDDPSSKWGPSVKAKSSFIVLIPEGVTNHLSFVQFDQFNEEDKLEVISVGNVSLTLCGAVGAIEAVDVRPKLFWCL